ncbi:(2R)-3-sulfolactate dehydrogenase (NADP+) [Afifella marina DSM 2698]|uniref:(2R)-3-sulfolactate dehydrogenase (NADP+) n=2 Tax=Afifella marina TaxID=1080 RepID=A0A1G5M453_AFIMA|nr:(2R)-3-sulfolactate dehydrogenase (NADP+) [Afifella marina DSM 2698]
MTQMRLGELRHLVEAALTVSRVSPENAASVAGALVAAEACGQTSHGLRRVEAYSAQARAGKIDGFAVPKAEIVRPATLSVDAAHGFAYPALDLALAELPPLARSQGLAMAGIKRSSHCGAMGVTVEAFAEAGLVALMFANAPGAMAPWGGRSRLYGTNPIAFAAPRKDAGPVVVDLSLSQVARGKVMAAKQRGEEIPAGWAFDAAGKPTTDPVEALAGTMAPLGGAKGTALALMVEMLAAGLNGANYASEASSFFDAEGGPPNTGQLIIAIDPAAFGADAIGRFGDLAAMIEADPPARVPGARRQALRAEAEEKGIEMDDAVIATVRAIASIE